MNNALDRVLVSSGHLLNCSYVRSSTGCCQIAARECHHATQGRRLQNLIRRCRQQQDKDTQRDALGSAVGCLLQHPDSAIRARGATVQREFIVKQARGPSPAQHAALPCLCMPGEALHRQESTRDRRGFRSYVDSQNSAAYKQYKFEFIVGFGLSA